MSNLVYDVAASFVMLLAVSSFFIGLSFAHQARTTILWNRDQKHAAYFIAACCLSLSAMFVGGAMLLMTGGHP